MKQLERDYQERLSHIHELFKLTRMDNFEDSVEVKFIERVAEKLHLSDVDLNLARNSEIKFTPPKDESDRIPQFHRYLLILGRNKKIDNREANFCMKIGLRMGLNPTAVEYVIEKMKKDPINMIPPKDILNTFKIYYN